ncbi:toll/interleukin-1 receptor domain-containing protein [Lacunimicrobium album]
MHRKHCGENVVGTEKNGDNHEIEMAIARLYKFYQVKKNILLQEVLVNSEYDLIRDVHWDNWNGGISGHEIVFTIPDETYFKVADSQYQVVETIRTDLNPLLTWQNEYIHSVRVQARVDVDVDWRQNSGLLLSGVKKVPKNAIKRLWEPGHYRLFLSHRDEFKKETAVVKKTLLGYGISSFVAHEDIEPSELWQTEIESALSTMDGFAALMTTNFHESNWTDQEIGYALARGVKCVALDLGTGPYGFIGKFQAIRCSWDRAAFHIARVIFATGKITDTIVRSLSTVTDYGELYDRGALLRTVDALTPEQADAIVAAFDKNKSLRGCVLFRKQFEAFENIASFINQRSGRDYHVMMEDGSISLF